MEINWSGYEWLTNERWGFIHPAKPLWWYDETAVDIQGDVLNLRTHHNPRHFPEHDIHSPVGAGLVSCTTNMTYGRYSLEAKLPTGPNLWPAFWMYNVKTWPPEIDAMEAYSNSKGSYRKHWWSRKYRVETNIWWCVVEPDGNILPSIPMDVGAERIRPINRKNIRKFNAYSILWTPDYIEIYFNSMLVRRCVDRKVLDRFNDHPHMHVIINNGIRNNAKLNLNKVNSNFQVRNFKYEKL
jgi:beta-glucanase (GH16 family)